MLRAFVVQLLPRSELDPQRFAGRVEHIDSGEVKRFNSLAELVSFMEHAPAEIDEQEIAEAISEIETVTQAVEPPLMEKPE